MSCNTQLGIDGLMEALQRAINQVPELRTPHSSTHRQLEKLVVKLRTSERPPIMRWQEYVNYVLISANIHCYLKVFQCGKFSLKVPRQHPPQTCDTLPGEHGIYYLF